MKRVSLYLIDALNYLFLQLIDVLKNLVAQLFMFDRGVFV
jgi:hypothetical protein